MLTEVNNADTEVGAGESHICWECSVCRHMFSLRPHDTPWGRGDHRLWSHPASICHLAGCCVLPSSPAVTPCASVGDYPSAEVWHTTQTWPVRAFPWPWWLFQGWSHDPGKANDAWEQDLTLLSRMRSWKDRPGVSASSLWPWEESLSESSG